MIYSNAVCGKKHNLPFMLMLLVKYSNYRAWKHLWTCSRVIVGD